MLPIGNSKISGVKKHMKFVSFMCFVIFCKGPIYLFLDNKQSHITFKMAFFVTFLPFYEAASFSQAYAQCVVYFNVVRHWQTYILHPPCRLGIAIDLNS